MAEMRACPCLATLDVRAARSPPFWPTEHLKYIDVLHANDNFPPQHRPPNVELIKLASLSWRSPLWHELADETTKAKLQAETRRRPRPGRRSDAARDVPPPMQPAFVVAEYYSTGGSTTDDVLEQLGSAIAAGRVQIQRFTREEEHVVDADFYLYEGGKNLSWPSLARLAPCRGLHTLTLLGTFDELTSIDALSELTELTALTLGHMPAVKSLRVLDSEALPRLASLTLRGTHVATIGRLSRLQELQLSAYRFGLHNDDAENWEPPNFWFLREACITHITRLALCGHVDAWQLLGWVMPACIVELEIDDVDVPDYLADYLEDPESDDEIECEVHFPEGSLASLRRLRVVDCGRLDSFDNLVSAQPSRLRSLSVEMNCTNHNGVGLTTLEGLAQCPLLELTSLSIGGMQCLTSLDGLAGARFPALRDLRLSKCGFQSLAGLASTHMPGLVALDLAGCERLTSLEGLEGVPLTDELAIALASTIARHSDAMGAAAVCAQSVALARSDRVHIQAPAQEAHSVEAIVNRLSELRMFCDDALRGVARFQGLNSRSGFSRLRTVSLSGCVVLTTLRHLGGLQLPALTSLELRGCSALTTLDGLECPLRSRLALLGWTPVQQ